MASHADAKRPHGSIQAGLDRFLDQTAGVHDLVDLVGPHAKELDAQPRTARSIVATLPSFLRTEDRERIGESIEKWLSTAAKSDSGEEFRQGWRTVEAVVNDCLDEFESRYVMSLVVRRLSTRSRRSTQFHRATLVSLMTYLESLMSVVIAEFYRHIPDAMGTDAKEFSLADLRGLESVDDAQELAVASRVEKVMNGGLTEWDVWFERITRKKFNQTLPAYDEFRESWERRNVFVHHGGRVSPQYLARVGSLREDTPELGELLSCSPSYLRRTTEVVAAAGFTIAGEILIRIRKEESRPDLHLGDLVYDLLGAQRWEAIDLVGPRLIEQSTTDSARLTAQVNLWIAQKQLDKSGWRTSVEAWDVGALSGRFSLAKSCLLDDFDRVVQLLPVLLDSKEVSLGDLEHWPLMSHARDSDERVSDILAARGGAEDVSLETLPATDEAGLGHAESDEDESDFVQSP